MVKISIIYCVLNSHEMVRRQVRHLEKIGIPDGIDIIFVDDGSDPPLKIETDLPLTLVHTNDYRPWTWPCARNLAAKLSRADHYLMLDLDHIVSRELLETALTFDGDFMRFQREFAVIDENGDFTQDLDVLEAYGWPRSRYVDRGVKLTPHRNQLFIHRDLYWKLGGFREDRIGLPYPQREDGDFAKKWREAYEHGEVRDFDDIVGYDKRPTLYMVPNGKYCGDVDHNPFYLFHTLSRKTEQNRFYKP